MSHTDTSVNVRMGADGSLVVQPHGAIDDHFAVQFRQVLVHAVRKVRPVLLILDLGDVCAVDAINLGTLAALCDVADDHHVIVFMDNSSATLAAQLRSAGVPRQRLRASAPSRHPPTSATTLPPFRPPSDRTLRRSGRSRAVVWPGGER